MGEWIAIILLVIIGLILIYIELLFVPGTTVVGVVGFALTCAGVYLTYEKHGTTAGNYVLVGSFLISVVATYFSFKSKSWDRFSLKDTNKGKFNEGYSLGLEVGMEGIATSDLKPVGNGEFGDKTYEVVSMGSHIESGSRIEIIKVLGNRITVERINN